MYSPKIKPEFIPLLYRKARELKIPMTELVNRIIGSALRDELGTDTVPEAAENDRRVISN
jgi:hypothetical protein